LAVKADMTDEESFANQIATNCASRTGTRHHKMGGLS